MSTYIINNDNNKENLLLIMLINISIDIYSGIDQRFKVKKVAQKWNNWAHSWIVFIKRRILKVAIRKIINIKSLLIAANQIPKQSTFSEELTTFAYKKENGPMFL